ncbi:DNA polymerase II subunit B4 [Dionaea muscipula]
MAKEAAVAATVQAEELPKAIVRRIVKEKLSQLSTDADFNLHSEALLAFSESARIFIHYLSATANDICKESRRQTINADDVLKALEEIEFSEFVEPLRASLSEFRKKNAGKRAGSAKAKEGTNKKRRTGKEAVAENGGEDQAEEKDEEEGS